MDKSKDLERQIEVYLELQKPIYHLAIDLGISAFKREIDEVGPSKSLRNKLIRAYKKRAWAEYHGKARHRGTFPTHPNYGHSIKITITEETTQIKVK